MDKQKQIEEMAKHGCYDGCASGLRKFCEEYDGKPCKNMIRIASGLYEQGYRKIPKNAVLIREEYEQRAYVNAMQNDLCKKCRERVAEAYEKIRKETAEKFAEKAKDIAFRLELTGNPYICKYTQGDMVAVVNTMHNAYRKEIDEICKEIINGVKTGENSGDLCVSCGEYAGEGRHVCLNCEKTGGKNAKC